MSMAILLVIDGKTALQIDKETTAANYIIQ